MRRNPSHEATRSRLLAVGQNRTALIPSDGGSTSSTSRVVIVGVLVQCTRREKQKNNDSQIHQPLRIAAVFTIIKKTFSLFLLLFITSPPPITQLNDARIHCSTSLFLATDNHVFTSHLQPFSRAHCSNSRKPPSGSSCANMLIPPPRAAVCASPFQ